VNISSDRGLISADVLSRSLEDRILAAGYESADVNFIGMHAVPGANADKELTEKGVSCVIAMKEFPNLSHSLEAY